ncbi:MAG: hypothetical protein IJZ37_00050 [Clostridia bacterium]|nr:hypothetical protein [Clostridia bacterium]
MNKDQSIRKELLSAALDGLDEKYIKEALCYEENRMAGLRYRDNTETMDVIDDPISDYINNRTVDILLRVQAAAFGFFCLLIHKEFLLFSFLSLVLGILFFDVGKILGERANLRLNLSDHDKEALYLAKKRRKLFLILRCISVFFIVLTAVFLILGI